MIEVHPEDHNKAEIRVDNVRTEEHREELKIINAELLAMLAVDAKSL